MFQNKIHLICWGCYLSNIFLQYSIVAFNTPTILSFIHSFIKGEQLGRKMIIIFGFLPCSDDDSNDRNRAMASALATFLKNVGVSNGALDRCPTFNTKDKTVFKFGSKNKKKVGRS